MSCSLVYNESQVKKNILSFFLNYHNNVKDNSILYENILLDGDIYNVINSSFDNLFDNSTRNIILKEAWELEVFSHGLGTLFINSLADFLKTNQSCIYNYEKYLVDNYVESFIDMFENEVFRVRKSDFIDYIDFLSNENKIIAKK